MGDGLAMGLKAQNDPTGTPQFTPIGGSLCVRFKLVFMPSGLFLGRVVAFWFR